MCVQKKKGQSWDEQIFYMDRGPYHLENVLESTSYGLFMYTICTASTCVITNK